MKKFLFVLADLFEDMELFVPYYRLLEEGYQIDVAGFEKKEYKGKHEFSIKANLSFDEVKVDDYEGMVIPGGWAPDRMRQYPSLLKIVKEMDQKEKMIAMICHALSVAVSADILDGRTVTGYLAIKDDCINAGAIWKDEKVIVDKNIITSRKPNDLPFYNTEIIHYLNELN